MNIRPNPSSTHQTESTIRLVMDSPPYLGATVALFLSGLAASAAAPQIATFLVNELGASLRTADSFTSQASPRRLPDTWSAPDLIARGSDSACSDSAP